MWKANRYLKIIIVDTELLVFLPNSSIKLSASLYLLKPTPWGPFLTSHFFFGATYFQWNPDGSTFRTLFSNLILSSISSAATLNLAVLISHLDYFNSFLSDLFASILILYS